MAGPFQRTRSLHRIAAGLLVVLLLGPSLSVASTCAADAPPTASHDHAGHGDDGAGHDSCCAEEGPAPDCAGATPCASPCAVLPEALVLDATRPQADRPEAAHRPGSLSAPPPRPPPIR